MASNFDSGVSVFKLVDDTAVPNHAPTLVATGNISSQRGEMRAAAEGLADVRRERAHVSSVR